MEPDPATTSSRAHSVTTPRRSCSSSIAGTASGATSCDAGRRPGPGVLDDRSATGSARRDPRPRPQSVHRRADVRSAAGRHGGGSHQGRTPPRRGRAGTGRAIPRARASTRWRSTATSSAITLDTRHPAAADLLERLIRVSDVLIENYRPGTLESMGLGQARCDELNPRPGRDLAVGVRADGPVVRRALFDPIAQAMSGLMALTGDPDGPPC